MVKGKVLRTIQKYMVLERDCRWWRTAPLRRLGRGTTTEMQRTVEGEGGRENFDQLRAQRESGTFHNLLGYHPDRQ